jgi:hypothetical protein
MNHFIKCGCVESARLVIPTLGLLAALAVQGCDYPLLLAHSPLIWGQVTHNGHPVRDGFIRFIPDDPKSDEGIVAVSFNGTYRVTENYRGRPLATGWYRITIQPNRLSIPQRMKDKNEPSPNPVETSKSRSSNPTENSGNSSPDKSAATSSRPQVEVSEIPVAYYEANTSPLKLWVRSQLQRVDINLLD